MIDFQNASFFKLKQVAENDVSGTLSNLLIPGEQIIGAYKGIRDSVTFTTKRVIAVNVQGFTGKKKDFTSLPYSKIQAFSIETAGVFDLDAELEIYFSGLGKVKFEFTGNCDIEKIGQTIGSYVL
ncbi:PH domain-containing protein [Clostridium sp. Marseille-P299]|uniref:PH domain-containing protein n=1 Tax=Clostridium sp. Marseille-P299 TaxID=1805477 RepID=UPI00082DDA5E|nr:PH domain-containing protein [Clostridium sp. Marseille-P299]